jgi:chromosome segregation ATPase
MNSILNPNPPKPPSQDRGLIPEGVKLALLVVLVFAVAYLYYDISSAKNATQAELREIHEELQTIANNSKIAEKTLESALVTRLSGDLKRLSEGVDSSQSKLKKELERSAAQLLAEGQKTKQELSQALATKADSRQVAAEVQAAKTDAENKIGKVTTEVGGVKTQVASVKTDLEATRRDLDGTRRDLEGTQRQLVDVRENLSAAIAKNVSELAQLRLKGERNYFEFTIPKKNQQTKVEDIRLVLTNTDYKKGIYSLKIYVDDNQLEKKDRAINEPIQFRVGRNLVLYELVINGVQKDQAWGYVSIPKDKALSADRPKGK